MAISELSVSVGGTICHNELTVQRDVYGAVRERRNGWRERERERERERGTHAHMHTHTHTHIHTDTTH